ncbi:accessory Sec system translocase SecA2 [Hutsoniella sourekii]|uniref:accessory Sec system translocase SecA2 n=1 Tax=Hutsoniella sourekii TaxID=87650 RepID=UPI0004884F23|nr:accessory Sec system translocase SecA2 [Hutsoniella sourekii]
MSNFLNNWRLRPVRRLLKQINALAPQMAKLSDSDLQGKTQEFQSRLQAGASLDSLLVEAYAVVREADKRVLGMYPYDVQVMGAIVMHQGNVAEMRTGEGKTLTATMPIYLNALEGKGAFLITVNDYLSKRDLEEMGPVYHWLGLTTASGVGPAEDEEPPSPEEKRAIYHSDIIYTTHSALGFDYLNDNLADSLESRYMRPLNYVLIDEIDEILMDSATTPLIISGAPRTQSNYYAMTQKFVETLDPATDFEVTEEKDAVWLLKPGVKAAEAYFRIDNLYGPGNFELVRHIQLALMANQLYEFDNRYIVTDGEMKLVDERNGRVLHGTKLQSGLHQAIEAKEGVDLSEATRAMATITYQNLFKLFDKMSGMTGTGKPADGEFNETYNMTVVQIPPNRPNQRVDHPDIFYRTFPEKMAASLEFVKEIHATGQPILLATGSVEVSALYSNLLLGEGISHSVLNAYNAAKEAAIIAEAGQLGAVTVATSMAGRGTDIKLGPGVEELGGLAVIGTERMMSERIDLQLRGRAGRQGDPGMSQFFACLEDELIIKFAAEEHRFTIADHPDYRASFEPLSNRKYQHVFDGAQSASDSSGEAARRNSLEFDENLRIQREIVYQARRQLQEGQGRETIDIEAFALEVVQAFLDKHPDPSVGEIERFIYDNLSFQVDPNLLERRYRSRASLEDVLMDLFNQVINLKGQTVPQKSFDSFILKCALKSIDENWIEEVDYLSQYKQVVQMRSSAQRNPIYEYQQEAVKAYKQMQLKIKQAMVRYLCLSEISTNSDGELVVYFA